MKFELVTAGLFLVCVAVDSMTVGSLESRTVGGNGIEQSGDGVEKSVSDGNERSGRRKRSGETPEERAINRQVRQLMKMKCRPQRVKINVTETLGESDEMKDLTLIPQVLAVRKCSHLCSYCGDEVGMERTTCVSVKKRIKKFTILYHEHGQQRYFKLPVTEDRKCKCLRVQ